MCTAVAILRSADYTDNGEAIREGALDLIPNGPVQLVMMPQTVLKGLTRRQGDPGPCVQA